MHQHITSINSAYRYIRVCTLDSSATHHVLLYTFIEPQLLITFYIVRLGNFWLLLGSLPPELDLFESHYLSKASIEMVFQTRFLLHRMIPHLFCIFSLEV